MSVLKGIRKFGKMLGLNKVSHIRNSFDWLLRYEPSWGMKLQGSIYYHLPLRLKLAGIHEAGTTILLKKIVKPGWIIYDLGTDFGYYTMLCGKLTGRNGKVVAFEPSAENFRDLKRAAVTNGLENLELHNEAVSDKLGEKSFTVYGNGSGVDTIYPSDVYDPYFKSKKKVEVVCTTLDNELQRRNILSHVNLVKIDVEGSELDVLKGGREFLEHYPDLGLIVEISPKNLEAADVSI